jgi:hypothetical protein
MDKSREWPLVDWCVLESQNAKDETENTQLGI